MRLSKINWVSHSNFPILSVDVQPNGYRFVTGGTDSYVCVWNLLPVISKKYEFMGQDEKKKKRVSGQDEGEGEDEEMKVDPQTGDANEMSQGSYASADASSQFDDDGLTVEERLKKEQRNQEFDKDVNLMEGLFQTDEARSQRLLAVLESHSGPVNCVRWNNLGTMFISADDEGSIILWEYRGTTVLTAFQARLFGGDSDEGEDAKQAFADDGNKEKKAEKPAKVKEDWKALRTWRGHRGTISDVAWHPDSMHFASCSTDSTICIFNINKHAPVTVLEAKANGLTFDPFGKFFASQSSEEKKLTIWRVQNFKNITKEAERDDYYKSQSLSQSLFRRLSWSSDGAFISTTGGKAGQNHIAPMIDRSNWSLLAALSGHAKQISVSRINPTLYKQEGDTLAGYSVIALASAESTITIWKPQLQRPLTILMDNFKMGVTDLSWGFNGNILLASSTDGTVMFMHFQPGLLGTPCSEAEKRLLIEKKYGKSILDDYVSNKKVQQSDAQMVNQLTGNTQQPGKPIVKPIAAQQTVTTNKITGKKKIVPVMVQSFQRHDAKIDPKLNPFLFQQLQTEAQPPAQATSLQTTSNPVTATTPVSMAPATVSNLEMKQATQVQKPVETPSTVDKPMEQAKEKEDNEDSAKGKKSVKKIQTKQIVTQSITATASSTAKEQVAPVTTAPLNQLAASASISSAAQKTNVSHAAPSSAAASAANQEERTTVNTQAIIQHLDRLLDSSKDILVKPLEDYQNQLLFASREDLQITLPQLDLFSDEIRVVVCNQDSANTFHRSSQVKVYNSANQEIAQSTQLNGCVVLATANRAFYAVYTTTSTLNIFSSVSTQLIKNGLALEGICFMASNGTAGKLATVSIKGNVSLFKVKDVQSLDSCVLQWQASVSDVIKARISAVAQPLGESTGGADAAKVHVESLVVGNDGSVLVYLTDKSRFEYSLQARTWRQISQSIELPNAESNEYPVKTTSGQSLTDIVPNQHSTSKDNNTSLSFLIQRLESQTLEDEQLRASGKPSQEVLTKITEFQEALELYERLQMKSEYVYAFRMLVVALLHAQDFIALRRLVSVFTAANQNNLDSAILTKFYLGESEYSKNAEKGVIIRCGEGVLPCGLEKGELFRASVVPVLQTYFHQSKDLRQAITKFCELVNLATDTAAAGEKGLSELEQAGDSANVEMN